MKTIAKTASGLRRYPLWLYAVLAVITLVGIGAWVYQLMNGHHVTDMSNATYPRVIPPTATRSACPPVM